MGDRLGRPQGAASSIRPKRAGSGKERAGGRGRGRGEGEEEGEGEGEEAEAEAEASWPLPLSLPLFHLLVKVVIFLCCGVNLSLDGVV